MGYFCRGEPIILQKQKAIGCCERVIVYHKTIFSLPLLFIWSFILYVPELSLTPTTPTLHFFYVIGV